MTYYKISLINNTEDKSYAYIIMAKDGSSYYTISPSPKLKESLDLILGEDVYILSPGVSKPGYSSDGVTFLQAGTHYYFLAIPEILAWRGYRAVFKGDEGVLKSMNFIPQFTIKNAGLDTYVRINDDGHRIVSRVPPGYVAVNDSTSRYLTAGQYLNANIDKEDNEWQLYENPYESVSKEDRQELYDSGAAYHPGLHSEQYSMPADGDLEDIAGHAEDDMLDELFENWDALDFDSDEFAQFVGMTVVEGSGRIDAEFQEQHMPDDPTLEGMDLADEDEQLAAEGYHRPGAERDLTLEESYHESLLDAATGSADDDDYEEGDTEDSGYDDTPTDVEEDDPRELGERMEAFGNFGAEVPPVFNIPKTPSVLFSPELNIAIDSDIFMDNLGALSERDSHFYEKEWWALPYPNDEKLDGAAKLRHNPSNLLNGDPRHIQGTDQGVVKTHHVESEGHLSESWTQLAGITKDWTLVHDDTGEATDVGVTLNPKQRSGIRDASADSGYHSPEQRRERMRVQKALHSIRANIMDNDPLDGKAVYSPEKAANLKVEGLYLEENRQEAPPGAMLFRGNFKGREYQGEMVAKATYLGQFEKFGGPQGHHGHMINASYGMGKTAVICASWAALNNRTHEGKKIVERGEDGDRQTMLITAPTRNIKVWAREYSKFLGEDAFVISGNRQQRETQWQQLVAMADQGTMPSAVIVAASAFSRSGKGTQRQNSMDASYMQLLARGGTTGSGEVVRGGHFAAMTIDESGQFVNATTGRQRVLRDVIDDVVDSGGLTYTLSGDLQGNSAADAASEMSFINGEVRRHFNNPHAYRDFLGQFMVTSAKEGGGAITHKTSDRDLRRLMWGSPESPAQFAQLFSSNVNRITGEFVAGDDYGLYYTDNFISELGHNWGAIYNDALDRMEGLFQEKEPGIRSKALGMINFLNGAGYGAVHPARMAEYDMGMDTLFSDLYTVTDSSGNRMVTDEEIQTIRERISLYQRNHTETIKVGGKSLRFPQGASNEEDEEDPASDSSKRNREFVNTIATGDPNGDPRSSPDGARMMAAIDEVLFNWDTPVLDDIVSGLINNIETRHPNTRNLKQGVGDFSLRSVKKLERLLQAELGDKVLIQTVSGDTSQEEVANIQELHNSTTDRDVITIVTSAGKYGLSLASDYSYRSSTWNHAAGQQLTGRFHRSQEQPHEVTVIVPQGIGQYRDEVAGKKRQSELSFINALESMVAGSGTPVDAPGFNKMMERLRGIFRAVPREQESRHEANPEDARARRRKAALEQHQKVREPTVQLQEERKRRKEDRKRITKKSVWGKVVVPKKVYNRPTLTRNPLSDRKGK